MDALLKLAKKEKLDELESAWMLAVEEPGTDVDLLLDAAEVLVDRGHEEQAESLLWYLGGALQERAQSEAAYRVARRGGMLLPESEPMRDMLTNLGPQVLDKSPEAEHVVKVTVGDPTMPLDSALAALDGLLALHPGSYVYDPDEEAVGCVRSVDPDQRGLVVEFEGGERVVPVRDIGDLEILPEDDFRALRLFDQDALRQFAEEDLEKLVRMVLEAVDRRMELRRLRIYLDPAVESWKSWWSGARDLLKRSAEVGMTQGRSPSLFLRKKPLTHQERLLRKFRVQSEPLEAARAALRVLREARAHQEVAAEAVGPVAEGLAGHVADCPDGEAWRSLPAAALLDALRREFPAQVSAPSPEVKGGVARAAERLAREVHDEELLNASIRFIRRAFPEEWADLLARMMPDLPRRVCEVAGRMLEAEAPDGLREACDRILSRTVSAAGAISWLWRRRTASDPAEPIAELDPVSVLFKLLSTGTAVVRDGSLDHEQRKAAQAEVRAALLARDGAALEAVLEEASTERLAPLASMVEHNPALTSQMQARVTKMLDRVAPAVFKQEVPAWEQDVIYSMPEGIEKRQAELEQLVEVRLPKVVREIGQAAQFGDISDNAEYQSAVRERGRLAEQAERMRQELSRTRPITPDMGSGDRVTVGSRVTARNLDTGERETFTFLGPWDADLKSGVYGYNAPLGEAFMGKRVGDTVTFRRGTEDRRWEVEEIAPADDRS